MGNKRHPNEFFSKGRGRGSEQCKEGINGSVVRKKLSGKTEMMYDRMCGLWDHFAKEHPEANPYDLASLKEFMKDIAFSIEGAEDDQNPAEGTVLVYWKQFMAGWRRDHDAIPGNITLSVTNFIKYELPEMLRENNMRLVKAKRKRRFGTKNHFVSLGRQLWGNDWIVYERPATRVYDWAFYMATVCSSARIGEYIESTCRPGSGRGLYYKDVMFGVFRNEQGNTEFAVQLVRDAKGMTHEPDKRYDLEGTSRKKLVDDKLTEPLNRPEHSLYEGFVSMPLICNPMLPILAILIASKAFKDYDTIDDLLSIPPPPEGEMVALQWKKEVLDSPFFKSMSSRTTSGKIESAGSVSKRLRALGVRAGYTKPPTFHDFRAEGLFWINKLYSLAQRMKHAGQKDAKTYDKHYAPNNSGVDGQASYFGGEARTIVNDLFRGLSLPCNPTLRQSLPAEKKAEIANSPEYIAIEQELYSLQKRQDADAKSHRKTLHSRKRKLDDNNLRQWQKDQSNANDGTPLCCHRTLFGRVRFLMPERDRLASTMFESATLRSNAGLSALRDMVALCEADVEVESRPGLEPDRSGLLGKSSGAIIAARILLRLTRYLLNAIPWSMVECWPLPASACSASVIPRRRLLQFTDRGTWKDHVHTHYEQYVQGLDFTKPVRCPHPGSGCSAAFKSEKPLRFHLLDAHCRDLFEELASSQRQDIVAMDETLDRPKKRQKPIDEKVNSAKVIEFIDETLDTALRHQSTPDSNRSAPPSWRAATARRAGTPPMPMWPISPNVSPHLSTQRQLPPACISACAEDQSPTSLQAVNDEGGHHDTHFGNATGEPPRFATTFPLKTHQFDPGSVNPSSLCWLPDIDNSDPPESTEHTSCDLTIATESNQFDGSPGHDSYRSLSPGPHPQVRPQIKVIFKQRPIKQREDEFDKLEAVGCSPARTRIKLTLKSGAKRARQMIDE
ncbi:hypothetical protein VDGL01_11107 [Verticillium dahliae]